MPLVRLASCVMMRRKTQDVQLQRKMLLGQIKLHFKRLN